MNIFEGGFLAIWNAQHINTKQAAAKSNGSAFLLFIGAQMKILSLILILILPAIAFAETPNFYADCVDVTVWQARLNGTETATFPMPIKLSLAGVPAGDNVVEVRCGRPWTGENVDATEWTEWVALPFGVPSSPGEPTNPRIGP